MSYTLLGSVINDTDLTADLSSGDPEGRLGYSSSINDDGDKVVVVAKESSGAKGRGRIFAFQYSGGSWSAYGDELRGPQDSASGSTDQCVTHDVDMNGDGTIFISGHPLHDRGTNQITNHSEGAVMIKKYNSGTSVWDNYGP